MFNPFGKTIVLIKFWIQLTISKSREERTEDYYEYIIIKIQTVGKSTGQMIQVLEKIVKGKKNMKG